MRKLMWFTVGFLIACFVGTFLEWEISWISVLVCAGIGMLLLLVTHWVRKVRIVAAIMLGLAVGLGWWMGYDALYLVDARELDGTSKAVIIVATDYSVQTDYGGKVEGNLMENGKTYRVFLYFDRMENFEPGDMIHTMARFTFTAQGGMQEPAYQRSDGIFLTASQRGTCNVEKPDRVPWYLFGAIWRNRISSGFETLFSGETLGFAKALILGERSDISYEVSTAFKVCGVSHIVAVFRIACVHFVFGDIFALRKKTGFGVFVRYACFVGLRGNYRVYPFRNPRLLDANVGFAGDVDGTGLRYANCFEFCGVGHACGQSHGDCFHFFSTFGWVHGRDSAFLQTHFGVFEGASGKRKGKEFEK